VLYFGKQEAVHEIAHRERGGVLGKGRARRARLLAAWVPLILVRRSADCRGRKAVGGNTAGRPLVAPLPQGRRSVATAPVATACSSVVIDARTRSSSIGKVNNPSIDHGHVSES
jgi:hypothetical protein